MPENFEMPAVVPAWRARAWRGLLLFAALLLLNAMLTFHNVWPTLFVHWPGELSIEFACVLLLLVAWHRLRGVPPPGLLATLAVLFVLGAVGRYGEVTAPALFGREINLYWDLQHVASLAGMLTRVIPIWLLMALTIGVIALLALLYLAASWSLRRIAQALQSPRVNAGIGIAAILMIGWFTLQRLDEQLLPRLPQFSIPVSKTYAQQLAKIGEALNGGGAAHKLPPSPAFTSTLSLTEGSDVMVVFLESYGRVAFDRPEFFQTLTSARAELNAAVRDTGRGIVSGFVESPTFGGGSWLAHLSFLSGIEVRDPGRYELLLTQSRRTFGAEFARHGYRRVALMPGLKRSWPEGGFYGFDQIYGAEKLDYRGPPFGWWRIPDQFALAKLDALEIAPQVGAPHPRQPLFTFFTTISTHTPFRPTPPYEADWSRLLGDSPFDAAALQQSQLQSPEWNNMGASYAGAVSYSLQTLAGYLRAHSSQDFIMIILGDHQPPAMVSGEHASWDVPVHVISNRPAVLTALQKCGFVPGVIPAPQTLGAMHQLAPTLLAAFEAATPCRLSDTH